MKPLKVILLGAVSFQAAAQNDTPDSIRDADYELVTTAMHTVRSETALPVTVLTGDELRNASRATIGDTLANQPGINNASFGPAVGQTVIRGQQGRRVMTLNNAIPNADASGNSADHAVTVEPILADAIEVLRGPSTLLYGGGAIGGVVNVIDNRIPRSLPGEPVINFESRHDTAADQDSLVGRLEFATVNLAWHLSGVHREWNDLDIPGLAIDPAYLEDDHEHEDDHDENHDKDHEGEDHDEEHEEMENTHGFVANTGGETDSATLGVSWVFDNGFIGMAVNRLENNYGLPPGAHDHAHEHDEAHEDDHEDEDHEEDHDDDHEAEHGEAFVMIDMESTRYDLTGEWRNPSSWIEHVDYRLSYTEYTHAELEGPGMVGTRFNNDAWQQRLQVTHNWHGVLGLQTLDDEFGARGEESFIPITETDSRGLFLVEDYHADNFTLEVGARLNRDDYSPRNSTAPSRDFNTFSYSASMLWDMNANASLGITASHAERPPSIEELYSNYGLADIDDCVIHFATGACEIGATGFTEEASRNVDATLYLEQGNISATITAFYNNFDDYIAQIDTGLDVDEFPVREYRQTDARFSGLEVDITYQFSDFIQLQVFGDTINGSLSGIGDAPRMPPVRIGSRLSYNGGNWTAFTSVLHARKQDKPGDFAIETDGYTRWDIGADYTFTLGSGSELTLFAKGRNLTDEEIRLSTSYLRGFAPEAGRSVEAGFRFRY